MIVRLRNTRYEPSDADDQEHDSEEASEGASVLGDTPVRLTAQDSFAVPSSSETRTSSDGEEMEFQ
jgi:hypothetical protein